MDQWENYLMLDEQPKQIPPMSLLLWNCTGIKNQEFKIHLQELINYHKPARVVLTKTKAGGEEAYTIMSSLVTPTQPKLMLTAMQEAFTFSGMIKLMFRQWH